MPGHVREKAHPGQKSVAGIDQHDGNDAEEQEKFAVSVFNQLQQFFTVQGPQREINQEIQDMGKREKRSDGVVFRTRPQEQARQGARQAGAHSHDGRKEFFQKRIKEGDAEQAYEEPERSVQNLIGINGMGAEQAVRERTEAGFLMKREGQFVQFVQKQGEQIECKEGDQKGSDLCRDQFMPWFFPEKDAGNEAEDGHVVRQGDP